MRKIGFLFIVIAIGVGLLLPWAQLNFQGEEIAQVKFEYFNTTSSSENQPLESSKPPPENTVLLKRSDNPVRIRFFAEYKIGGLLPPVKIPMTVKLSDKDGTLIGAIISFSTKGHGGGPDQPKVRSGTNVDVTVQNDGLHKLHLSFAPNKNNNGIISPDVERITASFIANASSVNTDYRIPALILAFVGGYLIVRSRKKRGDSEPKKPRWGRGVS